MTRHDTLPLADGPPPVERADAARNRRKILAAATEIMTSGGIGSLTVEHVAARAGVGVGTVYRRFTDRAGLLGALLGERELELQRAFMSGPPPLGPGAPPAERIRAFLHALADRIEDQREIFLSMDTGRGRRGGVAPHSLHHTHLTTLLRELRPDADAAFLATALLAVVSARTIERYREAVDDRPAAGRAGAAGSIEAVKAGVDQLLAGVAPPA